MQEVQFKVSEFEGPLDVLLELIEQKEMAINNIALAQVTEQFLAYIKEIENLRPEVLADFLVVAARLLVIKSKALLPNLELSEEDEDISGEDLAGQLLLLKKYRLGAKKIRDLENLNFYSFAHEAYLGQQVIFYPDPVLNSKILAEYARQVGVRLAELVKPPEHVVQEVISITDKIKDLQNQLANKIEIALSELVKTSKSKTEIIVTFLALLELVKQRILSVQQEELFAEVVIKKHPQLKSEN